MMAYSLSHLHIARYSHSCDDSIGTVETYVHEFHWHKAREVLPFQYNTYVRTLHE